MDKPIFRNNDSPKVDFKNKPNEEQENRQLSFKAMEREHYHKTTEWYIVATLLTMITVSYFIWNGSFTSAIVFVLILSVMFLFGNHPPRIIEIHITDNGIYIDSTYYRFKDINCFWIVNNKKTNIHALYLETGKKILRIISIQLHDIDDDLIRNVLNGHLDEDLSREEPTHSKTRRILKI